MFDVPFSRSNFDKIRDVNQCSTLSKSISCKYQLITKKVGSSFNEDEKYE